MIEFDASDYDKLSSDLGTVSKKAGTMAALAVKKTAKDIEFMAKTIAPVDTGNLRNSIKTSDLRHTSTNNPEAAVTVSAEYGVFLELGTSRMAPQPFMKPAADLAEPGFLKAMEQIAGGAFG